MKFHIIGANRETGDDIKMVIDAASKSAAEKWATDNDIIWSEITPHSGPADLRRPSNSSHVFEPAAPALIIRDAFPRVPMGPSGFGIAALVLGIISAVFCWIPFLGLLSVPVAAIGLLLGVIGFLISLMGRRSEVGLPVAGSVISFIAIVLAGMSTGGTAGKIAAQMQTNSKTSNETNQQAVAIDPTPPEQIRLVPGPATRPIASPGVIQPHAPESPAPEPDPEWVTADKAVRQGDVQVTVMSAQVGKVQIKEPLDSPSFSKDDLLAVKVIIKNLGDTKKLEYHSWAGRDYSFRDRDFATAEDNFKNNYKRITFGYSSPPVGQVVGRESVYPSKEIADILVFEAPIDKAEYINLELPARNFGGTGMLRIRILASTIQRQKSDK